MAENETRTPMEMASGIINATDPSTLALRAAARMYEDDGETGALLQMMYEQSADRGELSRFRRDLVGREGVQS